MARAGDLEHRRATLLAALLATPAGDPELLTTIAAEAHWPLPRTLVALAVGGEAGPVARRFSGNTLHGDLDGCMCVLVADPGGLRREAELGGATDGCPDRDRSGSQPR